MSGPGWWLLLPDDVDLVEEDDGTFTLATPPATPGYDPEAGDAVLERYPDGAVHATIEVRRELTDAVVLTAVLAELRRLGYTITAPPPDPPLGGARSGPAVFP